MKEPQFSFVEAPIYQGQKHFGVALGPAFIRQCLLDQNFKFQTMSVSNRQSRQTPSINAYEELSYLVEREVRRSKMPFIAGGDHSLSIGTIQGLLRVEPDLKVIWVDAHGDINSRATSLSGSFHGMPLSFLTGGDQFQNEDWFTSHLKTENLIYFGVRDLDKAEKIYLDKKRIEYYTAENIQKTGVHNILKQISKNISGSKVHLSVDSDAFDPLIAPSTGVPVDHGLSFENAQELIKSVLSVSEIISYEFVELNPQIFNLVEDVFKTAQIGIDLFHQILHYNDIRSSCFSNSIPVFQLNLN